MAYFERGGLEKQRGGSPRSSYRSENAIQRFALYVYQVTVVRGGCRFIKLNTLPFETTTAVLFLAGCSVLSIVYYVDVSFVDTIS